MVLFPTNICTPVQMADSFVIAVLIFVLMFHSHRSQGYTINHGETSLEAINGTLTQLDGPVVRPNRQAYPYTYPDPSVSSNVFQPGSGISGNSCPWDRPFVSCGIAPCRSAKCLNFPTAQCMDDYCGGCTARFYDTITHNEVTLRCMFSASVPLPNSVYPNNYNTVPMGPNGAGEISRSLGPYSSSASNGVCPPGIQLFQCNRPPCQTSSCPQFPTANCANEYCGGCVARYYDPIYKEVTNRCYSLSGAYIPYSNSPLQPAPAYNIPSTVYPGAGSSWPSSLQPVLPPGEVCATSGRPAVSCLNFPSCRGLSCPQFPTAICTEDGCAECVPRFRLGSTDVTSICHPPSEYGSSLMSICPYGRQMITCNFPPCQYNSCPGYPTARCYQDNCGLCVSRYFISATEVTSLCYSTG